MTAVVSFVVLVGVLIFVHELGHFACAKFFGVKVLKFSLGFGPRIAGIQRGETEYVIAWVPLGGYVRMLGEHPEDTIAQGDEGRSFGEQALWKRMIIVFAGPFMNLTFPVLIFFVLFLGNSEVLPAVVGQVLADRPSDGRLLPGDKIVEIDGEGIETWSDVMDAIRPAAGRSLRVVVERRGERVQVRVTPEATAEISELDGERTVGRIGISPLQPLPIVGISSPGGPAAAAGLRTFDRVVSVAGRPIERWIDLEDVLNRNRGSMLPVTYLRPVRLTDALRGLGELDLYERHLATLTPEGGPGTGPERAGLESSDLYIARVEAGSVEHRAGLLPGDRLESLDGTPIKQWITFVDDIAEGRDREHELVWRRGDQLISRPFKLTPERGVSELGQSYERYRLSIHPWAPAISERPIRNPRAVRYALTMAFSQTAEMIDLVGTVIVRLFEQRVSVRSIGSVITISEVATQAAREGPRDFLALMAFISVNLGLLNLLPIPMLDGGHLLFFLIEAVQRRPVQKRVREVASLIGLVMLLLLMAVAFTNDISRKWPEIVATFERWQ